MIRECNIEVIHPKIREYDALSVTCDVLKGSGSKISYIALRKDGRFVESVICHKYNPDTELCDITGNICKFR